jgi:hypothetical protein
MSDIRLSFTREWGRRARRPIQSNRKVLDTSTDTQKRKEKTERNMKHEGCNSESGTTLRDLLARGGQIVTSTQFPLGGFHCCSICMSIASCFSILGQDYTGSSMTLSVGLRKARGSDNETLGY